MVSPLAFSWKAVDNTVVDRMIDDSLTHMFSEHRKIRRKTKISNREFKQLPNITSYKKYIKIRNTILKVVSNNDDTSEDYFSNNDLNDAHQLVKSTKEQDNFNNENVCDNHCNNNETQINEEENGCGILTQCSNIETEIENNKEDNIEKFSDHENYSEDKDNENTSPVCSYEQMENELNNTKEEITVEQSPKCELKCFQTKEDIKRNLNDDLDELSNIVDNEITPKDSGIDDDDDSLDSSHIDSNESKNQNEIIEKSDNENKISTSPKKCQPIIKCTEIVTSKFKIILQDTNNQNDDVDNDEKLLNDSFDNKKKKNSIALAIPSETESLKYILRNLTERNCYKNDFFIDNYCQDKAEENELDNYEENDIKYTRPADLEDLVEDDDLIEDNTESTLAFEDITEDDEIILMEIPKSIIDNRELKGKNIKIKKRSVLIDGIKYESYRKPNDNLSCVGKMKADDDGYELGVLMPRKSIVIREVLSQPKIQSPKSISDIYRESQNNLAPFPSNLKRRNPLVLQTDCYNHLKKRKENYEEY
ncbi:hypothetical protein PV327_009873 [Microctonus hyperodae]|uniref:Uncharacterized protein n=1 Tax=Microctonus hyperodae TaxID=165561 RepID=A0AA39F1V7_MICHY|nr:hypothetical protein PV327_009873 [Microctonus hyperodae]